MDGFVEHAEEAFGCGGLGPIVVVVWRGGPTAERMERCYAAFERAARRTSGPVGMLSVVEAGAPPPPLTLLPAIAREFDRQTRMKATVLVLEDRGPMAIGLFEAASTLASLWKLRRPTKICVDSREAITWLAQRVEGTPERDAVLALVERVRAALPAKAPSVVP